MGNWGYYKCMDGVSKYRKKLSVFLNRLSKVMAGQITKYN